jgi:hypothetical protein
MFRDVCLFVGSPVKFPVSSRDLSVGGPAISRTRALLTFSSFGGGDVNVARLVPPMGAISSQPGSKVGSARFLSARAKKWLSCVAPPIHVLL